MKREIKFRVWDKPNEMYLERFLHKDHGWVYGDTDTHSTLEYCIESDDFQVEQFTGLRDKNRVDIYEGDILRVWHWSIDENFHPVKDASRFDVCRVRWGDDSGAWQIDANMKHINTDFLFHCSETEVIGNIHDNPELLNQTAQEESEWTEKSNSDCGIRT